MRNLSVSGNLGKNLILIYALILIGGGTRGFRLQYYRGFCRKLP